MATRTGNSKDRNPPAKAPDERRTDTFVDQKRIRRSNRGNGDVADWGGCDAKLLLNAIQKVTAKGCAIRFGYTRDQGAYAIGIVGDGEPYSEYVRPTEDIALYLEGLIQDFGG